MSRRRFFDRVECLNCISRELPTVGDNARTTSGKGNHSRALEKSLLNHADKPKSEPSVYAIA